jgi:hypothetical protein
MARTPTTVSFEDFAEVTMTSINRAIAGAPDKKHPLIRNPHITIGIIWRPDFNVPDLGEVTGRQR